MATAETQRKRRRVKIILFSLGLTTSIYSSISDRGGDELMIIPEYSDWINIDFIRSECDIIKGLFFLNEQNLRNLIINFFKRKIRNKITYITTTALCHVSRGPKEVNFLDKFKDSPLLKK